MTRRPPHINHLAAIATAAAAVLVPVMTVALLAATAPGPRGFDPMIDDPWGLAEGSATAGLTARVNDATAIEAYFGRESYRPGTAARLHLVSRVRGVNLQIFRVGPEKTRTVGNDEMNGVTVTSPTCVPRIAPSGTVSVRVGNWPSGLYFARLTAAGGRVGFAPFVVAPRFLGEHRVAVVMPTRTWQAYNYRDDDADGLGDTWYAAPGRFTARLYRPFLNRGVPPHFRAYDLYFLHWLYQTHKPVDILSQAEIDAASGARLRAAYDLIVFPGHHEYVTTAEYDAVERFRDLGGSLMMLSANNFFYRIDIRDGVMTRVAGWRALGRPEAALLGVQYIANDEGEHRGAWMLHRAPILRTFFAGTGAAAGDAFSNAGIEIDHTTSASPAGTQVLGEIPNLMGPGLTGQMTYYRTRNGAQVFAAGAFSLAGSIRQKPVARLVQNVWNQLAPTTTSLQTYER